jgi:hypothetical protein
LDSAHGFSGHFLLVIFGLVILDGHFCWSFLVIKNCIPTQIFVQSQWRYYQQLIVGIILLIVKIIYSWTVIPLIQDKIAAALLVITQNPTFSWSWNRGVMGDLVPVEKHPLKGPSRAGVPFLSAVYYWRSIRWISFNHSCGQLLR